MSATASGGGAKSEQAADDEADDRGAGDELVLVGADLRAPVGQLVDPAAQRVDRARELGALGDDVGADLLRAAARGAGPRVRSRPERRSRRSPPGWPSVFFASSIAIVGAGVEFFLTAL